MSLQYPDWISLDVYLVIGLLDHIYGVYVFKFKSSYTVSQIFKLYSVK